MKFKQLVTAIKMEVARLMQMENFARKDIPAQTVVQVSRLIFLLFKPTTIYLKCN